MCEEDEDKRSLSERWADAVFERDNFELTSMVQVRPRLCLRLLFN